MVAQERKPPHHVKEPVSVKGGIVTFGACPLVATGIRLRLEMSRRSHGLTSSFDMIIQHREVGVHLVGLTSSFDMIFQHREVGVHLVGLTSSFDMIFQHREVGVHLVEYLPQDIQYVVVAHLKRRTRRNAA